MASEEPPFDYGDGVSISTEGQRHALTPAAEELLWEYVEGVKRQLIDDAARLRDANTGGVVRLRDVQSAIDRYVARRHSPVRRFRRVDPQRAALLMLTAGVLASVAVFGLFGIFDRSAGGVGKILSISAALVSVTALVVGIGASAYEIRANRNLRRKESERASQEFLTVMAELEDSAREAVSTSARGDEQFVGLARIFSLLERLDYWTADDVRDFRNLLALRNSLVHEDARALTPEELTYGAREALRLLHLVKVSRSGAARGSRNAMEYEDQVTRALRESGFDQVIQVREDRGFDVLVDTPMGSVAVVVKYRAGRDFKLRDVDEITSRVSVAGVLGVVIVTNAELNQEVLSFNAEDHEPPVEVIRWTGEASDGLLVRAVARSAR